MKSQESSKPQTYIFIGRSGCGKGTQSKLLEEYLKKMDTGRGILYIQSGGEIRKFIEGQSFTQKEAKTLYDTGALQPEFITIYIWTSSLISNYTGSEHIIFDGAPRKRHEAGVLDSIFTFYNRQKPFIINLEISEKESIKRLSSRHRMDDGPEAVKNRQSWYEADVVPTLEYYKANPNYAFVSVNGERAVEDIHKDIVEKISLPK